MQIMGTLTKLGTRLGNHSALEHQALVITLWRCVCSIESDVHTSGECGHNQE